MKLRVELRPLVWHIVPDWMWVAETPFFRLDFLCLHVVWE